MHQDLNEYFQLRRMHVRTCYFSPVIEAKTIYKDEHYHGGLAEIFEETVAPMDGFLIKTNEDSVFWTKTAFKAHYQNAGRWLENRPRITPSDNLRISVICKGMRINVHALERSQEKTHIIAPEDGWIVEDLNSGRTRFYDDHTFRSLYDTKAPIMAPTDHLYRERKLDISVPIKFTRLHQEMLLRDPQGTHNINFEKGAFVVQLPESLPREYQVFTMPKFFRLFTPEKAVLNASSGQPDVIHVDFAARKRRPPR